MAKTKIAIHVQNSSALLEKNVIMLGETYVKKWNIPTNQNITIRFGSFKREVSVVSVARLAALRINEALADRMGIHHGIQLCLQYKPGTRTLVIGPLIGVMICRIRTRNSERPFGSITSFCKELVDACQKLGGFVYFFTPDHIPTQGTQIDAWSYNDRWSKKSYPLPDVVYNRLTSRILENRSNVQRFIKDMKSQHNAPTFNEKYLNKTEVFQALKQDPTVRSYLPESYPFTNYLMLKNMLKRHPIVFLKPILGSLGTGIVRISKQGDSQYMTQSAGINGTRSQSFQTLSALFTTISGKVKQQRYQIQQGLRLMEVNGRPVDFRALVQRDSQGEWSVTSIVARIAGNNHFVSNLARGGSLSTVKEAAAKGNINPAQRSSLMQRMRKASLDIAKGIETQIPAHFAELGVDLAVDTGGKIWLLEVNSKPSKEDNTPLVENKIRPSVTKVIKYAQFLTKS